MARQPYQGDCQRLLLAFDIGTTFSGISYSILTPGEVPEIKPVTRYLEGGSVGVDSKVPTVIYYDSAGSARAIGAKTQSENTQAEAEDNDWSRAYWFKLHLRPKSRGTMANEEKIPPLPYPHENVETIFADYMRYLYDCAKAYISETDPTISWELLKGDILYVLTHPNGWEGPQQDTSVTEEKEYRRSYSVVASKTEDLNHSLVSVHSYRGESSDPKWRMDEPDQYAVECKVEADVSMVKRRFHKSTADGRQGRSYYEIEFDVVLLFGLTELRAQIAYLENNTEKRGPATVIYDDEDEGTALWDAGRRGFSHNYSGETIDMQRQQECDCQGGIEGANDTQEIEALKGKIEEAQGDAEREREQLKELKRQFLEMERRLATNERLLKAQAKEVVVAPSFLKTADDLSGAEVSKMVVEVNDDIFQCASLMAEEAEKATSGLEEIEKAAREQLVAAGWNADLIRLVRDRVPAKDTVIFEALAQNVLVCWCHNVITSFCYGGRETDEYMRDLWERIATSKDHKVARNWLAITHSHLEKDKLDMTPIVESLIRLMLCTGWQEEKDITGQVETKVGDILTKALQIKEVVTQKILSAEVRVFYPLPGSQYDTDTMEDAYAVGSEAQKAEPGQPVFRSIGLGVEYIIAHPHSSAGERKSSTSVILKAPVVLCSTAHT
ncbi:hypothetical protein MD484_g2725, partial [Candolleomyces efflorescens]